MGTTLTHNVYLPDEGERNCYSGLANNWQILDDAVGAIAGKANASHTHGNISNDGAIGSTSGLPIITGTDGVLTTGSFGNTAGSFCEGNDSRLSDARTPVAHTHTKADITNLFNSANTWSANQMYTGILALSSSSDVAEQFIHKLPKDVTVSTDAQARFSTLQDSAGHYIVINTEGHWATYVSKSTALKYQNDSTKQGTIEFRLSSNGKGLFYPQSPFECDLGNSSNQWNNLYAKNYYYNGTQWGLDQNNTWTSYQTIKGTYLGNEYSGNARTNLYLLANRDTEGQSGFYIRTFRQNRAQGAMSSGDVSTYGIDVLENGTRTRGLNYFFGEFTGNVPGKLVVESSIENFEIRPDLINGINPGALSLPDAPSFSDISSNITNLSGGDNFYTSSVDGWVSICVGTNATSLSMYCDRNNSWGASFAPTNNTIFGMLPLVAGNRVRIRTVCGVVIYARFYPCQGNV